MLLFTEDAKRQLTESNGPGFNPFNSYQQQNAINYYQTPQQGPPPGFNPATVYQPPHNYQGIPNLGTPIPTGTMTSTGMPNFDDNTKVANQPVQQMALLPPTNQQQQIVQPIFVPGNIEDNFSEAQATALINHIQFFQGGRGGGRGRGRGNRRPRRF